VTAERARHPTGPGFADAVTFAFADPAEDLYGLARLVLWGDSTGNALAVLFAGGEPVTQLSRRNVPVDEAAGFERLAIAGLEATIDQPLERWTIRFDGGEHAFALTFEAAGPPAELDAAEPAVRAGELPGYEQLCHVHGTVRLGAQTHEVRCRGQRGHSWGVPDFDRIAAWRMLGAWLEDGTGVVLRAVRPMDAAAHGDESNWAAVLGAGGNLRVDDPRLSTTYDDAGRQQRAGLELWVGEEDSYPRRAAGEVLCGSTVDLGPLRLDCAFVRWRMGGRSGVGRYDVLRRA
jgi:hypothetical protein